jgi:hypothetical protein
MVVFVACDDPSLNERAVDDYIIEPVGDLTQLATIQIAQDIPTNIVGTITLRYNAKDLVETILDSRTGEPSYELVYNANNSLQQATKTENGIITTYDVTYGNDIITVDINTPGANTQVKTLFTDLQNRINRVVLSELDAMGNSTNREDIRYSFDPNFNVTAVNYIDMITGATARSSRFTYGLNQNPFSDMNDLVKLLAFEDFIPYTRVMPSTQQDFVSSILQSNATINYTLRDDNFPNSREIITTAGGSSTTRFEFFNYLP